MSRMAKKGLTTVLLVGLLAAPVAAAASPGQATEREAPPVAGWFAELVEWVGGWLIGPEGRLPDRSPTEERRDAERHFAANACEGSGSLDPNGAC